MPLMEDLYQLQREKKIDLFPFFYSAQFGNLAASGQLSMTVNIDAGAHYVARYFAFTAYTAGLVVAVATPPVTLQLSDSGSSRLLFDQPQAVQNICGGVAAGAGNGAAPYILPEPWLIRARSTVTVTIANLGATAYPRSDFSFAGFRVYKWGTIEPYDNL